MKYARIEGFYLEIEGTPVAQRTAIFSPDRLYRYVLTREWGEGDRRMIVIGLNPSTADEQKDDPTIRRCISFAKREHCDGLIMLNLFALRATNPNALTTHPAPIGPENDEYLMKYLAAAGASLPGVTLAAWGDPGPHHRRAVRVLGWSGRRTMCLGKTKHGYPRHPLYVRGDAPLERYSGGDE